MRSSDTHAGHPLSPNFGVRRLLRRGRLVLVLGGFALWLGAIGYAYCAALLAPAGASGNVEQSGAFEYGRALPRAQSDSDNPDCRQLFHAGTVWQPAAPAPVPGDETANLTLPPSAQRLALRADDRLPGYHPYPHPPGPPLYLRTLRLLI